MNRLGLGILLISVLYVNGQSETETNPSSIGYLYERPVNGLETPVIDDEAETVSTEGLEEEIVTEEQNHDTDSTPEHLKPSNGFSEREETLDWEDDVVKNNKRALKNEKMKKNSDRGSDIPLKRKNNLHRSYSQETGDNWKRKPVTGSKQKKIRQV